MLDLPARGYRNVKSEPRLYFTPSDCICFSTSKIRSIEKLGGGGGGEREVERRRTEINRRAKDWLNHFLFSRAPGGSDRIGSGRNPADM